MNNMDLSNKINILWISLMAPYDDVRHASGKIQNYYTKSLAGTGRFNIKMITFCEPDEIKKVDVNKYGIDSTVIMQNRYGSKAWVMRWIDRFSKINIYGKYAGLTAWFVYKSVKKNIKKLKAKGYVPQIIVLDWTEIALLIKYVKKYFPNTKVVSIEEDVSFLGHQRKAMMVPFGLEKIFLTEKARKIKKKELIAMSISDLVITNNYKDQNLIENSSLNMNVWTWTPYFQSQLRCIRKQPNKNIVYYGALFRPENWKSVLWFLDNVFDKILDLEVKFLIVGNNPPEIIKERATDRIQVCGFVDDIGEIFENSLCLVAPLVLGAGVKIKVLEGMSSGIPVLTNHIGIEGINAKSGKDFLYCENEQDYVQAINMLLNNEINFKDIERNAKKFISDNYNFDNDAKVFSDKLIHLAEGEIYEKNN